MFTEHIPVSVCVFLREPLTMLEEKKPRRARQQDPEDAGPRKKSGTYRNSSRNFDASIARHMSDRRNISNPAHR